MIIKRNKKLAWRIIEGQTYIIDPGTSQLHSLDPVGTRVWELISEKPGIDFKLLLKKLHSEYEVEYDILQTDLKKFIRELKTKNLVQIKNNDGINKNF